MQDLAAARTALIARLKADSAINAICGGQVAWSPVPQGWKPPYAACRLTAAPLDRTYAGPSGYVRMRVQIDCWATTRAGADALAKAVFDALDGAAFGPVVHAQLVSSQDSFVEPSPEALPGSQMDFVLHTKEQ